MCVCVVCVVGEGLERNVKLTFWKYLGKDIK